MVSARDETGSRSEVKGIFRHDSIQADLRETRNGVSRSYRIVYDERGEVRAEDTLSNHEFDDWHAQNYEDRNFSGPGKSRP